MDNLNIENTKKTPKVAFTTDGRIRINGRSTPEDASKFYDALYVWISEYCKNPAEITTVDIELEYFNSGTSKSLLNILKELVNSISGRNKLIINWYYEEGDDDILERGEYYESILDVKFNYIETNL
jgi:hypothetical protein